jgi:hypothetical protein
MIACIQKLQFGSSECVGSFDPTEGTDLCWKKDRPVSSKVAAFGKETAAGETKKQGPGDSR